MEYFKPFRTASRGVIVVDACSLLTLACPLPKEFYTRRGLEKNRAISLADTLLFLSHQGFAVVIPEMVAYECGRIVRDGSSVNNHLGDVRQTPLFANASSFLAEIPSYHGNIKIMPAPDDDASPPAAFMRRIWKIINTTTKRRKIHYKFQALQQEVTKETKKDYGEMAALNLIGKGFGSINASVFFLTDDRAAQAAATAQGISTLNSSELIGTWQQREMLPLIGVKRELAAQQLFAWIHETQKGKSVRCESRKSLMPHYLLEREFYRSLRGLGKDVVVPKSSRGRGGLRLPWELNRPVMGRSKPRVNGIAHLNG